MEFKVGDRVRRLTPAGRFKVGHTFTVVSVEKGWYDHTRLIDSEGCAHFAENCELIPKSLTETKLEAAKAEVIRLEKQLEEENQPKVGDRYMTGTSIADVVFVGRHFIVLQQIDDGSAWNKGTKEWSLSRETLKKNWTRK